MSNHTTEPLPPCPGCGSLGRAVVFYFTCGKCGLFTRIEDKPPPSAARGRVGRAVPGEPPTGAISTAGGSPGTARPTAPPAANAGGPSYSELAREWQGDAPPCPTCGAIAVRNGACYRCLNCGESLGCS